MKYLYTLKTEVSFITKINELQESKKRLTYKLKNGETK